MNWLTETVKKKAYRSLSIFVLFLLVISMLDACERDKENQNLLRKAIMLRMELLNLKITIYQS